MRATPKLVLIAVVASAGVLSAQQQNPAYQVVLRSSDLPDNDRQNVLDSTMHSGWPSQYVRDFVMTKVRDLGYVKAGVEEQRQTNKGSDGIEHLQLTETIHAGARYKVGTIQILKATVFTPDRLRGALRIAPGDVLAPSRVGETQEQIRELYASKGYINAVITPIVCFNDSKKLADISLELDEGMPHTFGELLLNGVEPGVAKQLWASWKTLHGRTFSPSALDNWLQANRTICPTCTTPQNISVTLHDDTRINQPLIPVADVTLKFPPQPPQ